MQEQGRLLLQDPFSMMQGRRKSERHIFLFEEMILFTKPRRRGSGIDWLDYKTSYKVYSSAAELIISVSDWGFFKLGGLFLNETLGIIIIIIMNCIYQYYNPPGAKICME